MNNLKLVFVAAISVLTIASCSQSIKSVKAPVKSDVDSLSYALGISVGKNLKETFPDLELSVFASAIYKAYTDSVNPIFAQDEEANMFIQNYMRKEQEKKANETLAKGNEFLAKNKERAEVKVTASGLQYEVLTEGTGAIPAAEDEVRVHYHGTLIDGTVFDSSVEREEPAQFPVNRVIPGWTEGLQLMKVGSKYKFYIPAELAYGPRQVSAEIVANSTLIFEVELLEIVQK